MIANSCRPFLNRVKRLSLYQCNGWAYNPNNNTKVLMHCCRTSSHISIFFPLNIFIEGGGWLPLVHQWSQPYMLIQYSANYVK